MSWHTGELVAFDLETTGTDPETDRIVTAAIVRVNVPAKQVNTQVWLADPGVVIPREATAIHGITTEYVRSHGKPINGVVAEVHTELTAAWREQTPVVVFNAPFDLTMLDRELRRHLGTGLGEVDPVVDPLVLDRAVDRYRKGSRKLAAVCGHYGLSLTDDVAHTSDGDALAAARLAWCLADRFPKLAVDLDVLQALQASWYRQWSAEFEAWLRERKSRDGASAEEISAVVLDTNWPLRGCTQEFSK